MSKPNAGTKIERLPLARFQTRFVDEFFESNSSRIWQLIMPPGSGKTLVASVIAVRALEEGVGNTLILTQRALVEQMAGRLSGLNATAQSLILNKAEVRRLEANDEIARKRWKDKLHVLVSIDLAKRPDIKRLLLTGVWSIVIIDDSVSLQGQRLQLIEELIDSGDAKRILILSGAPPLPSELANHDVFRYRVKPDVITDELAMLLADGQLSSLEEIRYARSRDEQLLFLEVIAFGKRWRQSKNPGSLRHRLPGSAASSPMALNAELAVVTRRLTGMGDGTYGNFIRDDKDLEEGLEDKIGTLLTESKSLLETADALSVDTKLNALGEHLARSIGEEPELCAYVVTRFASTAQYLTELDIELILPVHYFDVKDASDCAAKAWQTIMDNGGIAVSTYAGMKGRDMHGFDQMIFYDLPPSGDSTPAVAINLARMRAPRAEHYILRDINDTWPWERQMLLKLLGESISNEK